jgi:hypothetical protein
MTLSRDWVEEEGIEGGRSCFLLNGKATFGSNLDFEVPSCDVTDVGDPLLSYEGCATASSSSPSSGEDVTNRLLGRRCSGEADALRFGGNGGVNDISRGYRELDPISRQPASRQEGSRELECFHLAVAESGQVFGLCNEHRRIWQEV